MSASIAMNENQNTTTPSTEKITEFTSELKNPAMTLASFHEDRPGPVHCPPLRNGAPPMAIGPSTISKAASDK